MAFGDVNFGHETDSLAGRDELDHRTVVVDVDPTGHGELDALSALTTSPFQSNDLGPSAAAIKDERVLLELGDVCAWVLASG